MKSFLVFLTLALYGVYIGSGYYSYLETMVAASVIGEKDQILNEARKEAHRITDAAYREAHIRVEPIKEDIKKQLIKMIIENADKYGLKATPQPGDGVRVDKK